MMKKMLWLLAALMLAVLPATAEESVGAVKAQELDAFLADVRTAALASEPLNNPAGEESQSEDGALLQYDFVRIYAEETALSPETPVNVLVYESSDGPVFRNTGIDSLQQEVLSAFPLDNPELAGTREEAILYLRTGGDGGFLYGRVLRDGQLIRNIEYGEVLPAGDSWRKLSVTYALHHGLVTSIRMEGLNPASDGMDTAEKDEMLAEMTELTERTEYRAVKTSTNGLDLTALAADEMIFDGLAWSEMAPDNLPGTPETSLIDNEDGSWLLICDGDGYEAVFRSDEKGENASLLSFQLSDPEKEGPRGVRIGDLFSEDFQRFRSGENEMREDMTELLYGTEGAAPWGAACYDPAEMSLRYAVVTDGGQTVELLLKYEEQELKEIIAHAE